MEAKPRRPIFQPYIPVHRRNKQPEEEAPSPASSPRATPKEESEPRRRGRGQFRAPSSDDFLSSNNTSTANSQDSSKSDEVTVQVYKSSSKNQQKGKLKQMLLGKFCHRNNSKSRGALYRLNGRKRRLGGRVGG